MNNFIYLASSPGGGFPGGSERPGLPGGDVTFDFEWVFDVLYKILSAFGSLFDLMFQPMYLWFDYALSFLGLSDDAVQNIVDNISTKEFFQQNFFEMLFAMLPFVIVITLLIWIVRALP